MVFTILMLLSMEFVNDILITAGLLGGAIVVMLITIYYFIKYSKG